jgi:hypothetical protein
MSVSSPKREKAVEDLVSFVFMLRRWQEIEDLFVCASVFADLPHRG